MKHIRHVLFDFDGVLADYSPERRIGHLAAALHREVGQVHAAIYESGIEAAADSGRLDGEAYLAALAEALGCAVPEADWANARAAATRVRPTMLALATGLAATNEVAVLTNNGVLLERHLPQIAPGLLPLFAGRVHVTGKLQASKPSPEAFMRCLQAMGAVPGTTLFVDDSAANVAAASALGLQVHHFLEEAGLRSALAAAGLLQTLTVGQPDRPL